MARAASIGLGLALLAACSGDIEDSKGALTQTGSPTMPPPGQGFAPPGLGQAGQTGVPVEMTPPPPPAIVCGNGIQEAGETCDPPQSCPTTCTAADSCSTAMLMGSAATCDAQCVQLPITACSAGDGCCPTGCNSNDDADCQPSCGNGVLEEGEQCDPLESCPSECDDGNVCTTDSLTGQASDCSAACEHVALDGCAPDHARGVRVSSVTIDQGVRIAIAADGEAISTDARNAELVALRPAMVRAFWELDPSFEQRQIRAVLTLTQPDGTEQVLEASETVDAATADYGDLQSGFVWRLPAESMVPEAQYAIELFEADESRNAEPLPETRPVFPAEGSLALGVGDTYLKMRVMLVPLQHDVGSGCAAPDLDADFEGRSEAEYIRERIYALNPVDEVQVEVHEPVRFTGSARESNPIFSVLRQVREQDAADPGWYYFALIEPCDGGPSFSGVASLGSPTRTAANRRTGWGVYRNRGRAAHMVVHELGHQQGRNHVRCSGQEAGPDPDYPNNDGDTDSWGWDVLSDDSVYDPDRHDYMSYCNQTWVSEYGWNFVYPRLTTISGWELEHAARLAQPVLHVMVDADGAIEAWTGRSQLDEPLSGGPKVSFYAGGRLHAEATSAHEAIPKSNAFEVSVVLPDGFDQVSHVAFSHGGSSYAFDTAAIKRIR